MTNSPASHRQASGRDPRSVGAHSGRDLSRRTPRRRGSRSTNRVQRTPSAAAAAGGRRACRPSSPRTRRPRAGRARDARARSLPKRTGKAKGDGSRAPSGLGRVDQDGMRVAVLRDEGTDKLSWLMPSSVSGEAKRGPHTGHSLIGRRQVHFPFRSRSRSTLATSPQATASGLAARRYSRSVLPLWP